MRDLNSNLHVARAISPVSVSDNTAQVSQVFDCRDYIGVMLAIMAGSVADADATFTLLVEDSSDNTNWDAVADDYLNGTEVQGSFQFDDDNEPRKIGYVGPKRYVRATITPANNASAALLSAVWMAEPLRRPASAVPA
jgi:hypothetical protein